MIRTVLFSAAAALAVAIGLGPVADAFAGGPGGHCHGKGKGARLERAVEALELDDAKRAEVFAVLDAARPAKRELRGDVRTAHQEMRALLEEGAGEEAVLAKADEIGALRTELSKHDLRTLMQVRALLTDEQKAKLEEAMSRRHAGRGEWRRVL